MTDSPIGRTSSGVSPFTSPQGLGSLAPAVLPGLWRRASLQSQVTLQQQMSSLGQLPEETLASMTQLLPYGSALNLPGQIEQPQSPQGAFKLSVLLLTSHQAELDLHSCEQMTCSQPIAGRDHACQ